MGDYTPRRGFYRPGGGSSGSHGADEAGDIDKINDSFTLLDAISGVPTLGSVGQFPTPALEGDRCIVAHVEFRFDGTTWRAWNSDWTVYNPNANGFSSGTDYVSAGKYRYVAGLVRYRGRIIVATGGSLLAQAFIALPVTASVDAGARMSGEVVAKNFSESYRTYFLVPDCNQYSLFPLSIGTNGGTGIVGGTLPFGEQWNSSDELHWDVTYSPYGY